MSNNKPYHRRDVNGGGHPYQSNGGGGSGVSNPMMSTPEFKVRLFLFVACLWPLWVMALFGASAPGHNQPVTANQPLATSSSNNAATDSVSSPAAAMSNTRMNLRAVLDRVDVMGYGPTHPRVAVVIVGDNKEDLINSVKSVYSSTDINRLFVVCVVLDGHEEDPEFVKALRNIDSGSKFGW